MTVSFSRWFGRVQAGGKAEQPRYYPQRELLHRVSLTLVRCPNLEDTLPDLLSQVLLDAGCSSPVWLAWRGHCRCALVPQWNRASTFPA